jgi:branched-chain amino acid transport system substrate-binding protein
MSEVRRVQILLCVLSVVATVVSGCATPATPGTTPPTAEPIKVSTVSPTTAPTATKPSAYKIGVMMPLTGDLASYGVDLQVGALMAQDEINNTGGVNGVPIKVIIEDDMCSGDGGMTVLTKLHALGVPIICGSFCSAEALAVCERFQELGVVHYALGSNPNIATTCKDYTFQLWGNDAAQGPEISKIFDWLGVSEVATVYTNNDYSRGVRDAFAESFKGKIVADLPLAQEQTDFRTEITKLQTLKPKAVLFSVYLSSGAIFLKQATELGFETQYVGEANWGELENLKTAGKPADGMIALRMGSPDSPEHKNFLSAWKTRTGRDTFMQGTDYYYDMVKVAARAIALGGYTAKGIRDATIMAAADYVGPSGPKKMTDKRYVEYVLSWWKYQNGELVKIQH